MPASSKTAIPVVAAFASIVFLLFQATRKGKDDSTSEKSTKNERKRKSKCKSETATLEKELPQRKTTLDEETDMFEDGLFVKPIGVVQSIYRLCVGTPRQGLLAPHARGRLELSLEGDAVLGLDGYSHVWIVFVFHLNTKRSSRPGSHKTKVSPPALGGKKVGILSTRTPHRPNPIGITLCKLDSITRPNKSKSCKKTFLEVSGLDLVDGTPILDVKPFVSEYDSVPLGELRLPSWVSEGLSTRRNVTITNNAKKGLEDILQHNPKALDFYGTHQGDASSKDATDNILLAIDEVLSIDVRSAWQTKKLRKGKFQAERAGRVQDVLGNNQRVVAKDEEEQVCTQQLDKLLISYTVSKASGQDRIASEGSGAEDRVFVKTIELLIKEGGQAGKNHIERDSFHTSEVTVIEGTSPRDPSKED